MSHVRQARQESHRATFELFFQKDPDCAQGKRGFESKAVLKRLAKRHPDRYGTKPNLYRCPSCGLWHFSSMPKGEYQRRNGAL